MSKSLFFKLSFLCVLFIGIILIRLPFLSNVLQGEEGLFAYIVSGEKTVKNDDASGGPFLVARLNGKDYFGMPAHPILPYLFLEKIVRPIFMHADPQATTFQQKSFRARISFLFIFTLGLLLLFIAIPIENENAKRSLPPQTQKSKFHSCFERFLTRRQRPFRIFISDWYINKTLLINQWQNGVLLSFLLLFVFTSPLLVGGSIQPQLDGSIGVLIMGSVAFFLAFAKKNSSHTLQYCTLAGFISALGKNEWGVSLFLSVIFALILLKLIRKDICFRKISYMTVSILAGIIFGTLVSYLASPENFLGGFHTAHAISSNQQTHLLTVFKQNFDWIWQLGILAVFATILMFKNIKTIKNPFPVMVLYIYGLSLGGGFLLIPWLGDGFPRYYIPSYFILIFVTALLLRKIMLRPSYFFTCIVIFFLGSLVNFFSLYQAKKLNLSITSSPGYALIKKKQLYLDNYKKFQLDQKPAITGIAYGYYFPNADFVANSLGEQGVNNFLLTHSTKK